MNRIHGFGVVLTVVAAFVVGCGGSAGSELFDDQDGALALDGGLAGPDGSTADASKDAGKDGAVTIDGGACRTQGPPLEAYKACYGDGDCTFALHATDCCGSAVYVGVATKHTVELAACEAEWGAHFPPCGCASGPPEAEDGTEVPWGADAGALLRVMCEIPTNGAVGRCQTKVR